MIDPSLADALAAELLAAERDRVPVRQFSQRHPELTIEDAYTIQRAGVALATAAGRTVRGRKIGLTSRVMQQAVGIDEPDHGVLYDDMFFSSGDTVPSDRFIAPRIEVELAFVLGADLQGPDLGIDDVLDATDHVVPAIEILDTRFQMTDPVTGSSRTIVDTIADNAADAGIVVGETTADPSTLDLPWVGAIVSRGDVVEDSGLAAAVLGHPAIGVAWLADRLSAFGEHLRAGELVLSGSFIKPLWAHHGDTFRADFGPLGTVAISF